jgi:hypothetical protein
MRLLVEDGRMTIMLHVSRDTCLLSLVSCQAVINAASFVSAA